MDHEDVSDFGVRLPYLFWRVGAALSQRLDRTLKAFSLTQAQLSALALLDHALPGGLSNAQLSQLSGVTPQSMSTAIAGLCERGLVLRRPHETHGRIIELSLADAGQTLLRQVQVETKAREERDMAGLSLEQQDQLRTLLRTMMRNLDLHLPHEPPRDPRRET